MRETNSTRRYNTVFIWRLKKPPHLLSRTFFINSTRNYLAYRESFIMIQNIH